LPSQRWADYRAIPKAMDARSANANKKIAVCTAAVGGVKGNLSEFFMMSLRG
jgi:hypothetical protein